MIRMVGFPKRGFLAAFLLISCPTLAHASGYWEGGWSLNMMKKGATWFGQSSANSADTGYGLAGSVYFPVLWARHPYHLDLGIQDRYTRSSASSNSFGMNTVNIAARLELWRIFVGAGYGFFDFVNSPGKSSLSMHHYSNATSIFYEAGLIWRVIPEFQINLEAAIENGTPPSSSATSPTTTSLGISFRFPFSPKETNSARGVEFDGFRYPFGFMK